MVAAPSCPHPPSSMDQDEQLISVGSHNGRVNTYKLNGSVLRAGDRGIAGEPLRLPRSRPGLARAARALRDTRADPPDDRRIPFCPLVPAGPDTATLKPRDEPK